MISECICDDIAPKMQFLNMVIPILMHICNFVSNWSVASRQSLHVIQIYVTLLMTMTSNYFHHKILDVFSSDNALQDQVH